jgi:hypothetical protein
MQWIPSELFLLAYGDCNLCAGTGVRRQKRGQPVPCGCSLRGVFRACHARFRDCVARSKYRTHVSFERNPRGRSSRGAWGRKEEEYIADFELISRRSLDPFHHKIFRYHFLLGADWKLCCKRLGVDRGAFFHAIYRIEEALGKAFYLTEPYALYPPNDYFVARRLAPGELSQGRSGIPTASPRETASTVSAGLSRSRVSSLPV